MRVRNGRLEARLAAGRKQQFVGRDTELALFQEALRAETPPFAVLWIAGPGGVGKSTLLARLADLSREEGIEPVRIDARALVGSPSSVLDLVAQQLGCSATEAADAFDDEKHRVLLIDTAEDLGRLEDWLRDEFLPSLPERALTVIAGRRFPSPAWRMDAAWADLLRVIALRNLSAEESRKLLQVRGIDASTTPVLVSETHGHPLALALIADVVSQDRRALSMDLRAHPDVVAALLSRFVVDAPDELHRRALEVAAHVRITNEETLRYALELEDAGPVYDWLASTSFSVPHAEGLYLHDLAAHAIDGNHRSRKPESYVALHKRLRTPMIAQLGSTVGAEQYRAAMDLLWLHRFSAVFGPLVNWDGARSLMPAALTEAQEERIVESTRAFEGDAAAAIIERWIRLKPEAFTMVRSSPTDTQGFFVTLHVEGPELTSGDLATMDPRLGALLEHARATRPLQKGDRLELNFWLDYEVKLDPSAVLSQAAVGFLRNWLGPSSPTWSAFAFAARLDAWTPLMAYADFHAAGHADIGTTRYAMFIHDWRTVTPTAFFDMMAEREITGSTDDAALEPPKELLALEQQEFISLVKQALRDYCDDDALLKNPLSNCRVALDAPVSERPPLRAAIELAAASLSRSGKDEPLHAALEVTYLGPARTQEEAAELLGVPFSTYRRQLVSSVERVAGWLWERDLSGYPQGLGVTPEN